MTARRGDAPLVDLVRQALAGEAARIVEKPMFGGVCFMRDGHMLMGTLRGALIVRVGREVAAHPPPQAAPFVINGRVMKDYLVVEALGDAAAVAVWAQRCRAFVETLPPRAAPAGRRRR